MSDDYFTYEEHDYRSPGTSDEEWAATWRRMLACEHCAAGYPQPIAPLGADSYRAAVVHRHLFRLSYRRDG